METRPIKLFPKYFISQDGQVFSTNNSQDGRVKPIKPRVGKVTLCNGPQIRKQRSVKQLIIETWGVGS